MTTTPDERRKASQKKSQDAFLGCLGLLVVIFILWGLMKTSNSSDSPSKPSTQIHQTQTIDKDRQEKWKEWALKTGGVADVAFRGDDTIFIILTSEKYEGNIPAITQFLATSYYDQTGWRDALFIHVGSPDGQKIIYDGRYRYNAK